MVSDITLELNFNEAYLVTLYCNIKKDYPKLSASLLNLFFPFQFMAAHN